MLLRLLRLPRYSILDHRDLEFLSDSRIMVVDPFPKPSLACSNDCFIMERFFQHGYRGSNLLQLNYCRMHLHALRLSDLCTANGAHLTNLALEVHPDPCRSSPFRINPTMVRPWFEMPMRSDVRRRRYCRVRMGTQDVCVAMATRCGHHDPLSSPYLS
jgi:hypothetical protein